MSKFLIYILISRCGAIGSALALGARCCRFESCHFDHMKIIRTFSYLESRSDYLFCLSIPTLIARNENSRYHGLLTMVSAFALWKNTQIYNKKKRHPGQIRIPFHHLWLLAMLIFRKGRTNCKRKNNHFDILWSTNSIL